MSNNIKLGDDSDRLLWAADAKGYCGHPDGTTQEPVVAQAMAAQNTTAARAAAPGVAAAPATAGGDAGAAAGGTGGGAGTAGPVGGTAEAGGALDAAATGVGATPDQAQVAALTEWRKGTAIVKQLIASTIPDTLSMKIRMQPTAHKIWNALAQEFERKSCMVSVDLRRRLQEQRCSDRDDVRAHFAKLRMMRKDLAAMGQVPFR
ncbi:hypothetical protein ACG7TL_004936 [Trametes sanguinea]